MKNMPQRTGKKKTTKIKFFERRKMLGESRVETLFVSIALLCAFDCISQDLRQISFSHFRPCSFKALLELQRRLAGKMVADQ